MLLELRNTDKKRVINTKLTHENQAPSLDLNGKISAL